ncbi:MAG: type II secretion system protein [Flavobacteriales bacterium]|nr:type II secretion system protein [Flavobacteriales bacterium]
MVRLNKHRLKAFTLVETIVSLILISVSFGICFIVFNQVSIGQNLKQEAVLVTEQYLMELEEGKHKLENHSFRIRELEVSVLVDNYERIESAFAVQLLVLQKEEVLYTIKRIILINEADED